MHVIRAVWVQIRVTLDGQRGRYRAESGFQHVAVRPLTSEKGRVCLVPVPDGKEDIQLAVEVIVAAHGPYKPKIILQTVGKIPNEPHDAADKGAGRNRVMVAIP